MDELGSLIEELSEPSREGETKTRPLSPPPRERKKGQNPGLLELFLSPPMNSGVAPEFMRARQREYHGRTSDPHSAPTARQG